MLLQSTRNFHATRSEWQKRKIHGSFITLYEWKEKKNGKTSSADSFNFKHNTSWFVVVSIISLEVNHSHREIWNLLTLTNLNSNPELCTSRVLFITKRRKGAYARLQTCWHPNPLNSSRRNPLRAVLRLDFKNLTTAILWIYCLSVRI